MSWDGTKIKILAKENGLTLKELSQSLEVSRQTINDWRKGQVPRGYHLIQLSESLGVTPNYFFNVDESNNISVPLHRTRGVAKVTEVMKEEAFLLAKQYEKLFLNASDPGLVPVLRIKERSEKNALALATKLRQLSGADSDKPMNYTNLFSLLSSLNIITVFRDFPAHVKDYAFYCRIHGHRVVFINNETNVLDLIFPLIHEIVHAIRDEEGNVIDTLEEEDFCDSVAAATQFPKTYVVSVINTIRGRQKSIQINQLKEFSRLNGHSIFGIVREIKKLSLSFSLNFYGADVNVKKEFYSIGDELFRSKNARDYINLLRLLSPGFLKIIIEQYKRMSIRRLSELMGLDSSLDGRLIVGELNRINDGGDQ